MALLMRPPGEGRARPLCHSHLCSGEGVWLAGTKLVCLFEGFWVVFWVFLGVALISLGVVLRVIGLVCWGFSMS